jgi:hypothetical protein
MNFVKAKIPCESTGKRVLTQQPNAVKAAILFEVSGGGGLAQLVNFIKMKILNEASEKIARIASEFCQSKNTL